MTTPKTAREIEERITSLSALVDAQGIFISALGEVLISELPDLAAKLAQEMESERERLCGPMGENPSTLFLEIGLLMPRSIDLQNKKGS